MRAVLSFVLVLGAAQAIAQQPAPRKPVRPAPAPQQAPRRPPVAITPSFPDFDWAPLTSQLDMLQFELPPMHWEFEHDFQLPPLPNFDFPEFSWPAPDVHFPELSDQLEHLRAAVPIEPMTLMTPMAPMPPSDFFWHDQESPRGKLSTTRPEQGTPEDSLFRTAREVLNRGEYARASSLFQTFEQKYPRSRAAPSAMYWRAFALYRSGSSDELRAALETLKAQQERYPEAASDADAAVLRTRVYAALAARGDAQAAAQLRAANSSGQSCDREDMDVRAEALNALSQLDAPEARPTLKRVLARRDECSTALRRRAVYILGRNGTDEAAADLVDVAKSDPDPGVRGDAIMLIGRAPGATSVKVLEQIFNESSDDRTKQAVISALRSRGGADAKRALRMIIEKSDVSERARAEAILQLGRSSDNSAEYAWAPGQRASATRTVGDEEDAAFLRGLYGKTDSRIVKAAILSSVARIGGSTNEQWLLGIAKNRTEETSLRREAISRIKTSSLSIEELGKLFDALSERELRYAVVSQLASRDDPAAVDKLIEIARSGTDPQVRRQAISALAQKKDPRTMKLLLELVEKP